MLSCCKIIFLIVLKIQRLMKIWYFLIVRLIIFLMLTVIHAGGSSSVEMKVEKKQQQKTLVISSDSAENDTDVNITNVEVRCLLQIFLTVLSVDNSKASVILSLRKRC